MITNFDHLTLSTPHLEAHRALLKKLGFTERFIERDAKNPPIKRPLVYDYEAHHDLALFDAKDSLSIELVHQGNRTNVESSMVPIVRPDSLVSPVPGVRTQTLIDGVQVFEARIAGLEVPVFVRAAPSTGSGLFQACVIRVPNLERSLVMWQALGCLLVKQNKTEALLTYGSPFLTFTAKFYLIEMPVESRLDSYGFNYVAFMATSAAKERERFLERNISATPLGTQAVHGREFELFFAGDDSKMSVEILGMPRP